MRFIIVLGRETFIEEYLNKEKDIVAVVYFGDLDFSKDIARQLCKEYLVLYMFDFMEIKIEEQALQLGNYTIYVKNKQYSILQHKTAQQSIFQFLHNQFNHFSFLLKSDFMQPIILNRLFYCRWFFVVLIIILFGLVSQNLFLSSPDLSRKYELLKVF